MLNNTLLATADSLTDADLLTRLDVLARTEREACVELVAHLAVLDTRPCLYAADGYGSLFAYCTEALRLSEDAACSRIEAARACRRFPQILDLLASGALSLTTLRLIGRHSPPRTIRTSSRGRRTGAGARSSFWSPDWRRGPMRRP